MGGKAVLVEILLTWICLDNYIAQIIITLSLWFARVTLKGQYELPGETIGNFFQYCGLLLSLRT